MLRRVGAAVATMGTLLLLGVPAASAATEVGSNCTAGKSVESDISVVQTQKVIDALPLTVPADGVMVGWKMNVVPGAGTTPQKVLVLRATGNFNEFYVVAESAMEPVSGGQNFFSTRIPVQVGERFGIYGDPTLGCETPSAFDLAFGFPENVSPGSTQVFANEGKNFQVPIAAVIEPDGDGDGYGDETQDGCPTDAAAHGPCPSAPPAPAALSLSAFALSGKSAALVLAAASADTTLKVSGTVKLPAKGKRGGKSRRPRASVRLVLRAKAKAVAGGQITRFKLRYPGRLRSSLAALPRKRSLVLSVTVSGANAAGQAATSATRMKLPGQKRDAKRAARR